MEFDWKRELIEPHEMVVFMTFSQSHFAASSKPWTRIEDFKRERALFDQWRKKQAGVLKTVADWNAWMEYRKTGELSKKGVKRGGAGIMDQLKRNFLRAYVRSMWGLPGGDYKGMATFLTEQGYETSVDDLKYAKRSKQEPVEHAFDADDEVMEFINAVRRRFPEFEWWRVVVAKTTVSAGIAAN